MKLSVTVFALVGALVCALSSNASADTLTYATPGVVGTLDGQIDNSSPSIELTIAQEILDLVGLGASSPATPTQNYRNSTLFDYSATLSSPVQRSGLIVPPGYEYVLAKYDGQNAGYVLFHVPTFGSTLPQYPANFWTSQPTKWAISHFTTFDTTTIAEVDDGGATAALLAMALCGLAIAWRRVGILYEVGSSRHTANRHCLTIPSFPINS